MKYSSNTIFIYIVCFCLTGCSQIIWPFSEQAKSKSIKIEIPFSSLSDNAFYRFIDTEGSSQKVYLSPSTKNINIDVQKNKPTPFLFYSSETDSRPMGCLYPCSTTNSIIGGFIALIAFCLYNQSDGTPEEIAALIAHFNWYKLYEKLTEYENEALENNTSVADTIWSFDQEAIITAIASGTFDSYTLK